MIISDYIGLQTLKVSITFRVFSVLKAGNAEFARIWHTDLGFFGIQIY
jgi:hypothetical protein